MCLIILAIIGFGLYARQNGLLRVSTQSAIQQSSVETFWKPILDSSGNLLVGVESVSNPKGNNEFEVFPLINAFALARMTGYLSNHGKNYQLRSAGSLPYDDLAAAPSLLVGGFSNPWAMSQLSKWCFHFEQQPGSDLLWIKDEKNPSSQILSTRTSSSLMQRNLEYAVVARIVSQRYPMIVIAGLTPNGTVGATDCLLSKLCSDHLINQGQKQLIGEDIEAVLAIQVIDGRPGPSTVLAVETLKP
jgi:hypothetical protein